MYGLKDSVIEKIINVFKNYDDVSKVMLFGSRARNDFKKNSDIDLAVFSDSIDSKTLNLIRDDFYNLDIIYTVDVLHFEMLTNEKLKYNILNEGNIIYCRES